MLGELTLDSDIGWWEGSLRLPSGFTVLLYVNTPEDKDKSITDGARAAFEKMRSSEMAAREFAADELLATHNDEWCEGKKIDRHEFVSRLVLTTIQVWPNGDAEIDFGDGDLFWGHEVGVRYRRGRFTEAVVQG